MKGPPGPVGLTGRPGPVVSKGSALGTVMSMPDGHIAQSVLLPHLSSKGLPGYPGLKGELGEVGPQVSLEDMAGGWIRWEKLPTEVTG